MFGVLLIREGVRVSEIRSIDGVDFDAQVLRSAEPVLVDFWAPWCGFCQLMRREVESIARVFAGRLRVFMVNVDQNRSLAAQYDIFGIPELIIFRGGQEVTRVTGYKEKTELIKIINKAISDA